jgi:hypothetical protein
MRKRRDVKIDWSRLLVKAVERGARNSLEVVLVALLFGAGTKALLFVPISMMSAIAVKTVKLKIIG